MPGNHNIFQLKEDPTKTLGISVDAGKAEIRAAYLKKIKAYPPDKSPEEFERVRDAYETLCDPRKRIRFMLLSVDPEAPIASLLDSHAKKRRFTGPDPWLAAMKVK